MTEQGLEELLRLVGCPAGGVEDELRLSSLQVVTFVDQVEARCGIRLGSRDVTRANFRSRQALLALLAAKEKSCG